LKASVARINAKIPADAREDAIKQIQRLSSPELIANNNCLFIGGVMLAAYL
jgi:type I restriction enzyme R subunit